MVQSYDFAKTYEQGSLPAMRDLEREVLGCEYGGTSWTTRSEAHRIAELLGLRPGDNLLEIGAGSGWPGLYLSRITGCNVFLVDIPVNGLQVAVARAQTENISQQCCAIAASGSALPFKNRSFSILSHSDVLCCLPLKRVMLEECRRVASSGARMVFSVISPAPGLSAKDHRQAIETGPPFVEVDGDYSNLLSESGWDVVEQIEVTSEYESSVRSYIKEMEKRETVLRSALGQEYYTELIERRLASLVTIEHGLLIREIFVAQARNMVSDSMRD